MSLTACRLNAAAAVAVMLLSLPLYFVNLGTPLFWADEATTALIARQVLETGLPLTGKGNDAGSQDFNNMRGWRGLDTQIGWVQDYLGAAGMWLSGSDGRSQSIEQTRAVTTWARLPFALCGVLVALLAGLLVLDALPSGPAEGNLPGERPSPRIVMALWAAALALSSQVNILHARQFRYFAPTTLLAAAAVHGYMRAASGKRGGHTQMALAGVLLAFTNDVVTVATFAAIVAGHILLGRSITRRMVAAVVWPGAAFAVWVLVTLTANRYGRLTPTIWITLQHLVFETNAHILPTFALVAVFLLRGPRQVFEDARSLVTRWKAMRSGAPDGAFELVLLCVLVIGALIGIHGFVSRTFVRYLAPAVPFAAAGLAVLVLPLVRSRGWRPYAAGVLLGVLSFTDVAGWLSDHAVRSTGISSYAARRHGGWTRPRTLLDLGQRLRANPPRPIAAVLEFLWKEADPDDTVLVTYGDQTMRFYSRFNIYGGGTGYLPPPGAPPTWVWTRALSPRGDAHPMNPVTWIDQNLDLSAYEGIELPVPDYAWELRPDPDEFWSDADAPRVVLYRLTGAGSDRR